jgi:hypothetical protein
MATSVEFTPFLHAGRKVHLIYSQGFNKGKSYVPDSKKENLPWILRFMDLSFPQITRLTAG